jgi:hypothetical protein
MNNYKLTNLSGGPLGPLDLCDIFGALCDVDPQVVTLAEDEVIEFCGDESMDASEAQERLFASLAAIGSVHGAGGLQMSFTDHIVPSPPEPEYDPEYTGPEPEELV